jgi:hypothetical protein
MIPGCAVAGEFACGAEPQPLVAAQGVQHHGAARARQLTGEREGVLKTR